MAKKDKGKTSEKKDKGNHEEASIDWFEDHEPYDENEESDEDPIEEESPEEVFFDDNSFNQRMLRFITSQKNEVSLENILELPQRNLEDSLPKQREEQNSDADFDYIKKPEDDLIKYEGMDIDTHFSDSNISSTDRILEEQKALYKHLEKSSGGIVSGPKNEWNPVTPEETMRKDYLAKKKFVTGPS